ncbi:MAG: hypothetical protein VYA86_06645 [Candidatus Thermoplasmatota archaeon]|nr:hypothetical protein [Candidatus Thermoplasmatota archaeon]
MMTEQPDETGDNTNIFTELAEKFIQWLVVSTEKARADLKFNDYIYGSIADMSPDTDYSDDFKEDKS